MGLFPPPLSKSASWPMAMGAEGIAMAQFARCGFDVLLQAGRDKPWYDLAVMRAGNLLKVSVKASENGAWPLTSGYTLRAPDAGGIRVDRNAIEMWRAGFGSRAVVCLVQFEGVTIDRLPRIYLAAPDEIAAAMRETAERTGRCALLEMYEWKGSDGEQRVKMLPDEWHFSEARVKELLISQGGMAAAAPAAKSTVQSSAAARPPQETQRELALTL